MKLHYAKKCGGDEMGVRRMDSGVGPGLPVSIFALLFLKKEQRKGGKKYIQQRKTNNWIPLGYSAMRDGLKAPIELSLTTYLTTKEKNLAPRTSLPAPEANIPYL